MRESIGTHQERWDAIDVCWAQFLIECQLLPIYVPNNLACLEQLLDEVDIDGILLTGSGEVPKAIQDFGHRDKVERRLIEYALAHSIPIRGVCRGMQHLAQFFGATLTPCTGQISKKQTVLFEGQHIEVNSYHNFTLIDLPECFQINGTDTTQTIIKGIKHKEDNVAGIMWHPERLTPFSEQDKQLFQRWFL